MIKAMNEIAVEFSPETRLAVNAALDRGELWVTSERVQAADGGEES